MAENDTTIESPRLLDRHHLRDYAIFLLGIGGIVALYHLLTGGLSFVSGPDGPILGPGRPHGLQGPIGGIGGMGGYESMWPLWGTLTVPSLGGILLAAGIFSGVAILLYSLNKCDYKLPILPILVVVGVVLLFLTNMIQGWAVGIESTIGAASEMYWDIPQVTDIFSFISNYNTIQASLSLHAQTQPPGAVLTFYILNLLLQSPAYIAIGIGVLTGIISAFLLNGIYQRLFNKETSKYGAFLYLLLPAVQVYYLANIYAVVATLAIGAVYFYLHSNRIVSVVGTLTLIFLGTFVSFLFVYIPLVLLVFELISSWDRTQGSPFGERFTHLASSLAKLVVISSGVLLIYGLLYFGLGFNYLESFLYASSLENPNGFMLLASPAQYLVTRTEDVLDIVIFFGPVLSVLAYRGLKMMREHLQQNSQAYHLVVASLLALLLLFLTGAPKKGETARICMFVLPFLLIPVLFYLDGANFSRKEKATLLLLVLGQAILMQMFGLYIW